MKSLVLVLVLVLALGCSRRADAPATQPTPSPGARWTMPASSPIEPARQLVTVVIPDWSSTTAVIRAWQRGADGWLPTGPAWPGVIGRSGAAWTHASAPPSFDGPFKQEGDGKSPAGAFPLVSAFGYDRAPPLATRYAYMQLTPNLKCIDDPQSDHYDHFIDAVRGDWRSAETMRRDDDLYSLGVVVDANAAHMPGYGSCIFLHVWGGPGSTTVGCTAMAKRELASLVAWMDPALGVPQVVLLPRDEYRALAAPWGLPAQ